MALLARKQLTGTQSSKGGTPSEGCCDLTRLADLQAELRCHEVPQVTSSYFKCLAWRVSLGSISFSVHQTIHNYLSSYIFLMILMQLRGCSKSIINSVFSVAPFQSVPNASSRAFPHQALSKLNQMKRKIARWQNMTNWPSVP